MDVYYSLIITNSSNILNATWKEQENMSLIIQDLYSISFFR